MLHSCLNFLIKRFNLRKAISCICNIRVKIHSQEKRITKMAWHDPLSTALEIREQLASEKRKLAFFFGAGTSMAVGLPGIDELTLKVSEVLNEPAKTQFAKVKAGLPKESNVENVLDRIRILCELFGDNEEKEYGGIKGVAEAKQLDSEICQAICEIVKGDPPKGMKPHWTFVQWLRALRSCRDWPVEIFTTNYDLLLEKALEDFSVPFFDGFVGSSAPFFVPESVEAEEGKKNTLDCPPRTWTRLWKIHGSINWYLQRNTINNRERITRLSGFEIKTGDELVIFPSREKYSQSQKLPFFSFQDRLRNIISYGECQIIVVGYSFSDQHLNEIMFQGLKSNPRLAITAFIHSGLSDRIVQFGQEYRNLTFCGPSKACIGGSIARWKPTRDRKESEIWPFWDEKNKSFTLGDFNFFTSFLENFIGFSSPTLTTEQDLISLKSSKIQSDEDSQE